MTVWVDPEDVYTGQLYRLATPPSRAYLPQDEPELAAIHVATRQALALEAAHQPECVDAYFFAAVAAWSALFPTGADLRADDVGDAAALLYHANLAKFIATGQRFNRLDPRRGLEVQHAGRRLYTPTAYHGFAWRPDDFDCLELVGDYRSGELTHLYRKSGLGLPVVVVRRRAEREQFYRPEQSFAATALLQPSGPRVAADSPLPSAGFVLKFVNPASVDAIGAADCPICLAADLTSPFARQMALAPRDWLAGFLRPQGAASEIQLTMAEPYQRGKIPLVLVHGLLSEPRFWTNIANELNARPWFRKHYQVWFYRYPTGKGLLMSAAGLRKELQAAIALSPGAVDDPAASQMVLIGHSMGGLISKLQVTWSGNDLWDEVAHQPLDEIQAQPAIREQLRENLFFAPQPRVKRVIFLGVPHQGSADAQRAVGRLMARLVVKPQQLIRS